MNIAAEGTGDGVIARSVVCDKGTTDCATTMRTPYRVTRRAAGYTHVHRLNGRQLRGSKGFYPACDALQQLLLIQWQLQEATLQLRSLHHVRLVHRREVTQADRDAQQRCLTTSTHLVNDCGGLGAGDIVNGRRR